jgi:hypothetical protein
MSMTAFRRKLAPLTFAAGQRSTLELPRNYCLRHLDLLLSGALTVTQTTAGTAKDSNPAQLINRIEIVRDGSETIKSLDFEALHRLTQFRCGVRPRIDGLATTGAVTAEPVDVHARLFFAMSNRYYRPIDTMLDASRATTLHLHVTWGQLLDIFTSDFVGTVAATTVPTLKTSTYEMMNVPIDLKFNDFKEHVIQKQVTAASTTFQVPIPVSNRFVGFMIVTRRNGNPSDLILNSITLKSGTRVFAFVDALDMQMINRIDYSLENYKSTTSAFLENLTTGYYYLDLCPDGRLMEALNTAGLSSLEFELNVNSPGANTDYVYIYPEELLLAPAAAV